MKLVVDANIMFAALVKAGITADLMFHSSLELHAPEFILFEFSKYKELLMAKTGRPEEEFMRLLEVFGRRMDLESQEQLEPLLGEAMRICPDPKDVPYIALALKLGCAIWSNDKALASVAGIKVYSTQELAKLLLK